MKKILLTIITLFIFSLYVNAEIQIDGVSKDPTGGTFTGGTLTSQLVTSNLGIEFTESDTNPTCAAGNYTLFADLSATTLMGCINGTSGDVSLMGSTIESAEITDNTIAPADVDETLDYSFSILSGKQDRNNTAVDDDDCTGEQGLWWYDTTDSTFEFCNANSGVPVAVTTGPVTEDTATTPDVIHPNDNGDGYEVRDATNPATEYMRLSYDGTNGVLGVTGGDMSLAPDGGQVLLSGASLERTGDDLASGTDLMKFVDDTTDDGLLCESAGADGATIRCGHTNDDGATLATYLQLNNTNAYLRNNNSYVDVSQFDINWVINSTERMGFSNQNALVFANSSAFGWASGQFVRGGTGIIAQSGSYYSSSQNQEFQIYGVKTTNAFDTDMQRAYLKMDTTADEFIIATEFDDTSTGGEEVASNIRLNPDGGYVILDTGISLEPCTDSDTIADTGDANPATATLNPTCNLVEITCSDADTCDITMGETDTKKRQVTIINISANTVDFADTAGVSELTGAIALGQYDSIGLTYIGDRWVQTTPLVNN